MFANCQKGGINMGQPDVCKTPRGDGTPPIPYPNIAQGATANPGTAVQKVLISGTPAHTLQTIVPMSQGDESGVCGGVVSGMNMGPRRHLMGAPNVLIGGMPATRLGDPTGQNGMSLNVPGSTIAPAQTKVIINSRGGGGGGGGGAAAPKEANASQETTPQEELTVTQPRWEHDAKRAKEQREKVAHIGDTVWLKVDVKNAARDAKVRFDIYKINEENNATRIAYVRGEVANGVGTAKWQVVDPRRNIENGPLTLQFEGRVHMEKSERVELRVEEVAPKLILRDSAGAEAAPLMCTDWEIFLNKKSVAKGTTNEEGEVTLPSGLRPEKRYELRFADRTVPLGAVYQEQLGDALTPEGTQERLLMLGYHCGNEPASPRTKAALAGYRNHKALGTGEWDAKTADCLDADLGIKS